MDTKFEYQVTTFSADGTPQFVLSVEGQYEQWVYHTLKRDSSAAVSYDDYRDWCQAQY